MDHDQFLSIVARAARVDRQTAERAAQATLQTLGERIPDGEARQLAAELPPETAPFLWRSPGPAQRFDLDEFLRRVAQREGVDPPTAERHAAAVFTALSHAVSPKELGDVVEVLPTPEFARLLPRGPVADVMPADEFFHRVAERAAMDYDAARRATDAVLETLAERIAGGEVEDLVYRLPLELHEPLRRGVERSGGRPLRMTLDDFLERVAEREGGVDPIIGAGEHTRAVLTTLHEAVGDDEWVDVTAQLPHDFDTLVAH